MQLRRHLIPTRFSVQAFTLVELIAVMALLVTVIAVASPSLAGFFRGRALDLEARRFMSLTRQGQSRAAAEGIPMILWVDLQRRTYGLEADSSFVDEDTKAIEYQVDTTLNLSIGADQLVQNAISEETLFGASNSRSPHATLPQIRFEADGGISSSSPENFQLAERDGGTRWVCLSLNRLNYEIRNEPLQRITTRR